MHKEVKEKKMDAITAQDILMEDLQGEHREYANIIGIEALIKLCDEFGGSPIYLPTTRELKRPALYRLIKKEYAGGGISQRNLARKYNISESTVYRLTTGKNKVKHS